LLGSPRVIEENLIAGAIPQSNLGGGRTLGLDGDYGTTYSSYYTVNESYAVAGQQIFRGLGCNQTTLDEQISCLKTVPAQNIQDYTTVARYVVQDGSIVNTQQLIVSERNSSTAHVPVMFGTTTGDGKCEWSQPLSDLVNSPANPTPPYQEHRSPPSRPTTSPPSPKASKPAWVSPPTTLSSPSPAASSPSTTQAT